MALVQIEDTELAALRSERDAAKSKVDELSNTNRELTTKVETAEAAQKAAEKTRDDEKARADGLEEKAQHAVKRDERLGKLGAGFLAKLGDTSRTVLTELAAKATDEDWELAVKEREELAKCQRDDKGDGNTPPPPASSEANGFQSEEVASFMRGGVGANGAGANGNTPPQDGATSVRKLARAMGKSRTGQ